MKLTQREKQLIIAGLFLLGMIIIFHVLGRPALEEIRTLRRVVSDKGEILVELRAKSEKYKNLTWELEKIRVQMAHQPEGGKILSFVERVQRDSGLMQKVVYMKPFSMTVNNIYERNTIEIKLQSITLNQLIQFLLKIKSSDLKIGIRTLEIKRGVQNSELLDTTVQLVSLSAI
jgi:type II secretory pathway component PulM